MSFQRGGGRDGEGVLRRYGGDEGALGEVIESKQADCRFSRGDWPIFRRVEYSSRGARVGARFPIWEKTRRRHHGSAIECGGVANSGGKRRQTTTKPRRAGSADVVGGADVVFVSVCLRGVG
jgi:hypothetical protein